MKNIKKIIMNNLLIAIFFAVIIFLVSDSKIKVFLFLSSFAALLISTICNLVMMILSYAPTVVTIAISCVILGPIKAKIDVKLKQRKKTEAAAVGFLGFLGAIFGAILPVLASLYGLSLFSVTFTNSFFRRHTTQGSRVRGNSLPPATSWGWDCLPNTHYTNQNFNDMMAGNKTTITQEGHQYNNNGLPQFTGQTWNEQVYLQAVVQQNTGRIIHINHSQSPFPTTTIQAP